MKKTMCVFALPAVLLPVLCVLVLSVTAGSLHAGNIEPDQSRPLEIGAGDLPDEVEGLDLEEYADRTLTINLKQVAMEDFLALVAEKTGLRFLIKPEIKGIQVTAFLPDVKISTALDAILTIYDLEASEVKEGILLIDKKVEKPFDPIVDMAMELIALKYADAHDMKDTLEPFLSEHGKIAVVERSGYTGWGDADGLGARRAGDGERRRKVESGSLIIRERKDALALLKPIVENMDVRPDQILISAHIIEARHDDIRDIGFDWDISRGDLIGGLDLGAESIPVDASPGLGLEFLRVDGRKRGELTTFFRILEEKAGAEILSSPRLLVSDSQETNIMVGERFPILLIDVDTDRVGETTRTATLDYYEEIGVQLNVIPRIQHGNRISMIIRPVISTASEFVEAFDGADVIARYPIIDTRSSETQVSIEDGQTIVIGGLIKEAVTKSTRGVPLLQHLPLAGRVFRRDIDSTEKIDLLIFLSADIVREPAESTEERIRKMGEGTVRVYENELTLRTHPDAAGTAVDLTDAAPYNINEEAGLETVPNTGYEFTKWTGHTDLITEGTPEDKQITIAFRENDAWLTANYELIDYSVSVKAEPEGDGTAVDRTGAKYYNIGDRVRLRARTEPGYEFAGWQGDTRRIDDADAADTVLTIYDSDVELKATFEPVDYMLTFRTKPESESVVRGPFHIGHAVTLEAKPSPGYRFVGWTGDTRAITAGTRREQRITVTIPDSDLELIANFEDL